MPANQASLDEALRYAAEQEAIRAETARRIRNLWLALADDDDTDLRDAAEVFGTLGASILRDGQAVAVRSSDTYLARYLQLETGEVVNPVGLEPSAFLGVHGTDASVPKALSAAVLRSSLMLLNKGHNFDDALANARRAAGRLVRTEVAHAGRSSLGWLMGEEAPGRPRTTGYRRMTTSPKSCAACLSAAGATFNTDQAFRYHPGCGCVAVPVVDGVADRVKPPTGREVFEGMSSAEQDRALGVGAAQAVRAGAPLSDFVSHDGGYFTQAPLQEAQ